MQKKSEGKVISYRKFFKARYPNGAPKRYYFEKALDTALATAITVGTVATMIFMFAIF